MLNLEDDNIVAKAEIKVKIREDRAPNFKYLRMLVDSGNSADNLISYDYFRKLSSNCEIVPEDMEQPVTANNQPLAILGRAKVPLEIHFFSPDPNESRHVTWRVRPLVVDGLVNDFLMCLKAQEQIDGSLRMKTRTFTLHFDGPEPPLVIPVGRRDIKCHMKNKVVIPPHCEKLVDLVVPDSLAHEEFLIEPNEDTAEQTGVLSVNVVDKIRPDGGTIMRIWNPQDHPVTIPRGTEWALANPYSDVPREDCVAALAINVVKLQEKRKQQWADMVMKNRAMKQDCSNRNNINCSNRKNIKANAKTHLSRPMNCPECCAAQSSMSSQSSMKKLKEETPGHRETGTGAEQLLKEHWPTTRKEMFKRLWAEFDFDSPDVKLTRREKMAVVKVFAAVPKALALGPYDVGLVEGIELSIETGDHPPIADKCRPLPRKRLEALKAQVKRWLGQGVAEWGNGPWASATVVVKKTNGGLRFCADYRALNKITDRDARPVAHMGEKLARIKSDHKIKPKFFASIDLSDAYYCVPVKEEHRDKTAMISPLGLLRFNRMSFGLKNAPAMWNQVTQMIENKMMEKNPEIGNALLMYFDDAVLSAVTFEELCEKLQAFLEVIAEIGCKVQPRKCKIGQRIKFLGHIFDEDGIYPNTDFIDTMKNWGTPMDNKDLATMCGQLEWVEKFVHNTKVKTHAIWDLKSSVPAYRKNVKPVPIDWYANPKCQEQWDAIMDELCSAPVLAHPDWSEDRSPFILDVDTSSQGIGCILSQEQWVNDPETGDRLPEKQERVISFASKRLKGAEHNYSAYKLELFGLYSAIQHWHYFLIDGPFIVRSDHKALKWLTQTINTKLPSVLQRWQEVITGDYEFDFQWVPGTQMKGADALSRKKYVDGDDGNMAEGKLREDPLWLDCDVDPSEASEREDDDFWLPLMSTRRKRKAGEISIVGAITRSKRKKLNSGLGETAESETIHRNWEQMQNISANAEMEEDEEDQPEEDLFSTGEGPPLAQFETPDESWEDVMDGLAQFPDDEEDMEVKIRPKTAWWWHEFLRHEQDRDIGILYLKELIEQSKPWPKSNKEINSLVIKVFQDHSVSGEEENTFRKMLMEQRNGAKFQISREEEDDPGILTIRKKGSNKELFVIPFSKWQEHVQLVHHGQGTFHRGCDQTLTAMEEYFWFANMKPFVQTYINQCRQCQNGKRMPNRFGTNLGQTSSNPNPRLKKWAVDLVEMPAGKYGMKYLLTMLDVSTRFMEAWPLSKANAQRITKIIEEDVIPRYGENLTFMFDMGSQFVSKLMRKSLDHTGCKRYFSTPYHANSFPVERSHRTLVSLIRILLIDRNLPKESWPDVLHLALYTMRCCPDSDSKTSAYERTFGFPPPTQISSWTGTRPDEVKNNLSECYNEDLSDRSNEDVKMREVTDENPGMYPETRLSPNQEPELEVVNDGNVVIARDNTGSRQLTKIPGKTVDFYSAVNALAWSHEYAQSKKDEAAKRRHQRNARNFNDGHILYRPLLNELVDWHMPIDPASPESRKLANYWNGMYSVTALRPFNQTVQIQKVEMNNDGRLQALPEMSREVYVGDLRPTLMLSFQNRPHGDDWNPSWTKKQ